MSERLMFMDVFNSNIPTENIRNQYGRILFDLTRSDLSYYDRKNELEKINSYKIQVLVHLCMLTRHEAKYQIAVNDNKKELVNKWMLRTVKICKEYKVDSYEILQDVTDQDSRKVNDILRNDHDWIGPRIEAPELRLLYLDYFSLVVKLTYLITRKSKSVTADQCYERLDELIKDYEELIK